MSAIRIRAGTLAELDRPDRVLTVRISDDPVGTPREALVLRDPSGIVRAFVNLCRHLPIPLDGGSKRYLDESGVHLMCGTHGARYRREDGYCFEGPCRGRSLFRLPVSIDPDGTIWIDETGG